jgi:hypothetical protein
VVIGGSIRGILARFARCEVAIAYTGVVEGKHCFLKLELFIDRA